MKFQALDFFAFAMLVTAAGCGSSKPANNIVGSLKGDWASECSDAGNGGSTQSILSIAADGSAATTDKEYARPECAGEPTKSNFTTMKFSVLSHPKSDQYQVRITDVRETNSDPAMAKTVDTDFTVTIVSDQQMKFLVTGGHFIMPGSTEVTEIKVDPRTENAEFVFNRVRL